MKCILLCAGYATRLFPLTQNFPKALLEIEENKPLLDYILEKVNKIKEVDEIYLITNDRYYEHFLAWSQKKENPVIPITVINDHTTSNEDRLGAIGDIEYVIKQKQIEDDVLIIAGDNLFDFNLTDMVQFYYQKKGATVCVKEIEDYELLKRLAVAKTDENDRIIDLAEKPAHPESNIGVFANYIYPKEILPLFKQYLEEGNVPDAPGYFVQYLYKIKPVYAYRFQGNCFDVGTHESLKEVRLLYRK